jgi:hypothetical protein
VPKLNPKLFFTSLMLLGILLAGCGDSSDAPSLDDWSLKTNGLTLSKDLQVSETENYFFGSIQDLDVTSEGRMVVLDADATHLKVLRPDGTLIDTLGRQGQGPGEFQRPRQVHAARGDSVFVFDVVGDRITVFTPPPSSRFARSMLVSSDVGNLTQVHILKDRLAGRFTPGYTRKEGLRRPSPAFWRVIHGTGVAGDTLLKAHRRKVATFFGGPGAAIAYLPFGRRTRVAPGPDAQLYHGSTDSLHVQATSLDGTTAVLASVPAEPVAVTDTERDSVLEEYPGKLGSTLRSTLPATKPAFTDLAVADDGRLWIQRPKKRPSANTVEWWVLDPETKTIRKTRLPSELELEVVQDGRAYSSTTTEMGAPAVVRYQIES